MPRDDEPRGAPAGGLHDRIYERYLSTTYAACNDLSEEGLQRAAAVYRREIGPWLPADRDAAILEIGCGVGALLDCCRDLGYRRVEGIDVSPEQVELCRRRGHAAVEKAAALPFLRAAGQTWTAIVMSDVLEHLPRQQVIPTLEEAYARLRPGGRVILRVPNLSNPFNLRTRYVDFTHESGFTLESAAQVLRTAGFRVEAVHGTSAPHRRWLARLVFDRLLWWGLGLFMRHTMRLSQEIARGKNLIAVGRRPPEGDG